MSGASAGETNGSLPVEVVNAGYLTFSVVSSIAVVSVNKYLFRFYAWPHSTLLTLMHLLVTLGYAHAFAWYQRRKAARDPRGASADSPEAKGIETGQLYSAQVSDADALLLAASNSGSIVFMNLNLNVNSVGFYQLSKLTLIPVIATISFLFLGKRYSMQTIASLAVVCAGAALASGARVHTSLWGVLVAALAVIYTAFSQLSVGNVMERTPGLTSVEVIRQTYGYAVAIVAFMVPFVDDLPPVSRWAEAVATVSPQVLVLLAVSCSCAFGINLATAMVIGRFSAITNQAVSHLKTVLMFTAGYLIFGESYPPRTILGILIALVGLVLYSRSK